jgi:four helix bundle protein
MVLKVEDLDIYQMAEDLSDRVWEICIKWDYFAKDTVGKQLVRAADSISANLAEGHGRYHFNDRLKYCYYSRGSLEETKSWISKAIRRNLIKTEISEINHALELLPKKLNAYIGSIKKARELNKRNAQAK